MILTNETSGIHPIWTHQEPGYWTKWLNPRPSEFIGPAEEWLAEYTKRLEAIESIYLAQERRSARIF